MEQGGQWILRSSGACLGGWRSSRKKHNEVWRKSSIPHPFRVWLLQPSKPRLKRAVWLLCTLLVPFPYRPIALFVAFCKELRYKGVRVRDPVLPSRCPSLCTASLLLTSACSRHLGSLRELSHAVLWQNLGALRSGLKASHLGFPFTLSLRVHPSCQIHGNTIGKLWGMCWNKSMGYHWASSGAGLAYLALWEGAVSQLAHL